MGGWYNAVVFGRITSKADSLLNVAAREGFWLIGKDTLAKLAHKEFGMARASKMTLFELVMALAKKILKCTEQEAIDIAESRLARMSSELSEYDKVAEDPELEDLIDPNDRAEWLKHIEKRTAQRSERKEFRSAVQKNSPASTPCRRQQFVRCTATPS